MPKVKPSNNQVKPSKDNMPGVESFTGGHECDGVIDWVSVERRVRSLSRYGDDGVRLIASPEDILAIAGALADIYRRAGRPLPDILAALI